MHRATRTISVRWILWLLSTLFALSTATAGQTARDAQQILSATGNRGGLIVHLGCGDGELTAALHVNDAYLVHGLDRNINNVQAARQHIRSLGLYGTVSVERWTGSRLPYGDNLVNLLVIEPPDAAEEAEVLRVLAPGGGACTRRNGRWEIIRKPWPDEIDEWTHFLRDATGNAVSHDSTVGPPKRIQWVSGPAWARSHENLPTMSLMISAGGRIFYIMDEGPTASVILPARWSLIARDAFNGKLLWKKPIQKWDDHLSWFRCMYFQVLRRMVATKTELFVTLGLEAPVSAIDTATGQVLRTYDNTALTEEMICIADKLIVLKSRAKKVYPYLPHRDSVMAEWKKAGQYGVHHPELLSGPRLESVMAIDIKTGQMLWEQQVENVFPRTLASDGEMVVFQEKQEIVCIDLKTGAEQWRTGKLAREISKDPWMVSATLILYKGVVLYADVCPEGKLVLTALSTKDGSIVWDDEQEHQHNRRWIPHHFPVDLFVADDLVWMAKRLDPRWQTAFRTGWDPLTGRIKRHLDIQWDPNKITMGHHRCYRNKATDRYILTGSDGIEFVDLRSGQVSVNNWVRGICNYGIMPCNGLVYAPPHSCACSLHIRLNGFLALAPKSPQAGYAQPRETSPRPERGPAYNSVSQAGLTCQYKQTDWPTYRHDRRRSGSVTTTLPAKLEPAWQARIGGKLSSITAAGGHVYVSQIDAHTVHALDLVTGKTAWSYTADGRIDGPPTIYGGRAVLGSADGSVYCLDASDGKLIWRFRPVQFDRRIVAEGQLESAWPVHGSVLVQETPSAPSGAAVCFAAGRSPFLDGGLRICRLDLGSGSQIRTVTLTPPEDWASGKELLSTYGPPDILSADEQCIYMRHLAFDPEQLTQKKAGPHLISTNGFLDSSWWHRAYWIYGTKFGAGWGGWKSAGNSLPSGRIMAFNDDLICGFGRNFYPSGSTVQWSRGEHYVIFASEKGKDRWSRRSPLLVRAMVLAGKNLFLAGPPYVPDAQSDALEVFEGRKGVLLHVVSAADGKQLAEYKLESPPVFDGMIVADNRLYVSTKGGKLLCMAPSSMQKGQ